MVRHSLLLHLASKTDAVISTDSAA